MTLTDLAYNISIPLEDFKAFVEERFNIILLSKHADVPDFVVRSLFEDPETVRQLVEFREKLYESTHGKADASTDGDSDI